MKPTSSNDLEISEEQLKVIFSSFKRKKSELIPILQSVQTKFGYLPESMMLEISNFTGVPESQVFGVSSFYAQFRLKPIGKNRVILCRGTACHVRGAPKVLEEASRQLGIGEGETSEDLKYTLETVACMGCCALAPVIVMNDELYGKMSQKRVKEVLGKCED